MSTAPYKLDSTRTVVVTSASKLVRITADTPRGVPMLVSNRAAGVTHVAMLRTDEDFYTHWAPLPVYDKD